MQLAIQEPYMLMVQPDDFFISPRKLDENFGTMICFHRRYDLCDEHNYGDNKDFLKDLYLKTVGNDEKGEEKYDRLLDRLSKQPDTPFGTMEYARAVNQALMTEIEKEHMMIVLREHTKRSYHATPGDIDEHITALQKGTLRGQLREAKTSAPVRTEQSPKKGVPER